MRISSDGIQDAADGTQIVWSPGDMSPYFHDLSRLSNSNKHPGWLKIGIEAAYALGIKLVEKIAWWEIMYEVV